MIGTCTIDGIPVLNLVSNFSFRIPGMVSMMVSHSSASAVYHGTASLGNDGENERRGFVLKSVITHKRTTH